MPAPVPCAVHAEAGIEPGRVEQAAEQPEEAEARSRTCTAEALADVMAAEMAEFVGQHGLDFGRRQAVEQGVEEDDALVARRSR